MLTELGKVLVYNLSKNDVDINVNQDFQVGRGHVQQKHDFRMTRKSKYALPLVLRGIIDPRPTNLRQVYFL